MPASGLMVYQEAQARELDQGKMILMMYAGAIRFCNRALEAGENDPVAMGSFISRAKNVVLELMASLNFEQGGEMADILMQMYRGLFVKLHDAHMNDTAAPVSEVRDVLVALEESWRQVFSGDEYQEFLKTRHAM